VNDVTTFYYRDVLSWQPIHQDRPIGVVEGRALCCGEQLQWHRTALHERLEVPPLSSKSAGWIALRGATRSTGSPSHGYSTPVAQPREGVSTGARLVTDTGGREEERGTPIDRS
jgi:hypothetical protein